MNNIFWEGIKNRNVSYITGVVGKQYVEGKGKEQFKKIKNHIQINLNNYNEPKNRKIQILKLKDIETNETFDILEIHNVNLEVIKNECYNKDVSELTGKEKVSKFLLSKTKEDIKGVIGKMDEILDKIMALSNDEKLIGLYNEEELREAREYGMRLAGINEGIEQKQKEVVINMLKDNLDIELISKYTNMDSNEIEKIKNEIN